MLTNLAGTVHHSELQWFTIPQTNNILHVMYETKFKLHKYMVNKLLYSILYFVDN